MFEYILLSFQGGKKSGILISAPAMPTTLVEEPPTPTPSPQTKPVPDAFPDYDEVPEVTRSMTMAVGGSDRKVTYPTIQSQKAVENEYVPSPESSPKFDTCRVRSHTIAEGRGFSKATPFVLPHPRAHLDDQAGKGQKHLSIVSMESGLSFGYDADKEDFNPTAPIGAQPWFHGILSRSQAEELLLEDGDFLVRENVSLPVTYTLSVRHGGACEHMLIASADVIKDGQFLTPKYQVSNGAFDSIPELVFNHLKYLIPVNTASGATLTNPVCRPGSKGLNHASYAASSGAESPVSSTLPKNFGSQHQRSNSDASQVPMPSGYRNSRCVSTNSGSPCDSPTRVSMDTPFYRTSSSSTDLLLTRDIGHDDDHGTTCQQKRSLGKTVSSPIYNTLPARLNSIAGNHQRVESFEDYQVMVSASSVLEDIPNPPTPEQVAFRRTNSPPPPPTPEQVAFRRTNSPPPPPTPEQVAFRRTNSPVKYADLKSICPNSDSIPRVRKTSTVNYVEIRFDQGPNGAARTGSEPLTRKGVLIEPVGTVQDEGDSPYQSRAKLLAQRARIGESTSAKQAGELQEIGSNDSPYQSRAAVLAQRSRMGDASPSIAKMASEAQESRDSPYQSRAVVLAQESSDSPYQSRAKLLAQKVMMADLTADVAAESPYQPRARSLTTSVALSPSQEYRANVKIDSDANYSIPKPHTSLSYPSGHVKHSHSLTANRQVSDPMLLTAQSDGPAYDIPGKHLQRSISGGPSPVTSSGGSPLTQLHVKALQGLPGGDALLRMHTLLSSYSTSELAYHLTKADAVTFMLSPRPGESASVWTERFVRVGGGGGGGVLSCGKVVVLF